MEVRSVVFGALDVKFKVDGWPCLARRSVSLKKKITPHCLLSFVNLVPGSKEKERGPWEQGCLFVYKWVPVTYCWGYPRDGLASHPGEEAIFLIASFHSHRLRSDNMGDLWPATRVGRYTPGCKENVNENVK